MAIIATGGRFTMSIGERVELSVAVTQSSAVLTDFNWELPLKHILDDYIGPDFSFRKGKKVPYPESDLKNSAVSFCWAEDGEYKISVKYKMDGADKQDEIHFKVHRPNVQEFFATTNGAAATIIAEWGTLGMVGPHNRPWESCGIVWTARVQRGSAYRGRIGYIQLTNMARQFPPHKPIMTGGYVLDGAAGKNFVFYWGKKGTRALNDQPVTLTCSDQPASRPGLTLTAHLKDKFKLYLMYQSERPGSIWVPLGKLHWEWNAKFKRDSNIHPWVVDGTPTMTESETGVFPINEFPEWTKYAPDFF
jgi:hypothetical protein